MTNRIRSIFALVVVFAVAIALRWDIAMHFTHLDDIGVASTIRDIDTLDTSEHIAARIAHGSKGNQGTTRFLRRLSGVPLASSLNPVIAFVARSMGIPRRWTYAPLQFIATSPLLAGATNYRQTLLRGRLPSWIAAMLAIWAMFLLARRLWPDAASDGTTVLAAMLTGVSAEMVVYSKQMENYTLGVLGLALQVLLLFWIVDRDRTPSYRSAILAGVALAIISSAQYQLLVFTPAFFGAWFLARRTRGDVRVIVAAGVTWGALVSPIYVLFLRHMSTRGINWNAGPAKEFAFHPAREPGAVLMRLATFFPKNIYLTFEAAISPVVDSHPLYRALGIALALLALAGAVALVRSADTRARTFVQFSALVGLIYVAFVLVHRFPLGPTRHTLVLLPIAVICVVAGAHWLRTFLPARGNGISLALAALIGIVALLDMPRVAEARRDPVDEDAIGGLVAQHGVTAIVEYEWTVNMRLMPSMLAKVAVFEGLPANGTGEWVTKPPVNLDRVAFFSTRAPLTDLAFDSLRKAVNINPVSVQSGLLMPPRSEYATVYTDVRRSDVEVDISRRTHNGTNEVYLYILERKPAP